MEHSSRVNSDILLNIGLQAKNIFLSVLKTVKVEKRKRECKNVFRYSTIRIFPCCACFHNLHYAGNVLDNKFQKVSNMRDGWAVKG